MQSITIEIPENRDISKNNKYYSVKRGNKKPIRQEYRDGVNYLIHLLRNKIVKNNVKFKQKEKKYKPKVFVEFIHFRDADTCDAHNFSEAVCDAIKEVIGIDDRYYKTLFDFENTEEQPTFRITITQIK